jgi:tetratricopeptide (TPR) repeat protein
MDLSLYYQNNEPSKALEISVKAIHYAEKTGNKKKLARIYNNRGIYYSILGDFKNSLAAFQKANSISNEINDKPGISQSLNNIGIYYFNQGEFLKALKYYTESAKMDEAIGDEDGMLNSYNNIGIIYKELGRYKDAEYYYSKALKLADRKKNPAELSMIYSNLGLLEWQKKNLTKASEYFLMCLTLDKQINDSLGIAKDYGNIGIIYYEEQNYDEALKYHLKAIPIYEKVGDQSGITLFTTNLGSIYEKMNQLDKAEIYSLKGAELAKQNGLKDYLRISYTALSDIYKKRGDYKKALEYKVYAVEVKDSLLNEETSRQVSELQAKYETEKKEKEIELLNKQKILQQTELDKKSAEAKSQNTQRNALIGGIAFVLLLAGVSFKSFRDKKRDNALLEIKNHIIEEKNKDITDSINYARQIQHAILPFEERINRVLNDYFILFKPKDIVSGDFYWFLEKENYIYMAVVDCTGHGVPGAFMSMIGSSVLGHVVSDKNILQPDLILNEVHKDIRKSLKQQETNNRDGMDIALIAYDKKNNTLEFAGAMLPLYIIQNGELKIVKGDKLPIGGIQTEEDRIFTKHSFDITENTTVYLSSDGYADQFGGEKGKKFMGTRFRELLLTNYTKPLNTQKETLNQAFESWKAAHEQVDDVTVIGIKFS